jgi:proteasome assembly chaperone (PAC2) family protein
MGGTEHIRWISEPKLVNPTVIAAFTGWNDAADAASSALQNLVQGWGATALAEIDPELFTDFATIRPHVKLSDGRARKIVWPTIGLWHARSAGSDVILLLGPEPSLRWRLFSEQVLGVFEKYDSKMFLTLGALLADVPHSRPVQLIGTATDENLVSRFSLQRSRYEGPTGIVGVLHDACAKAGMPSASLWAAVPAYAGQISSPKAAVALMQRACDIIGTPAPVGHMIDSVAAYESQLDSMIEDDDDLQAYVNRLETMSDSGMSIDDDDDFDFDEDDGQLQFDFATDNGDDAVDFTESADGADAETLMEEVEQFLRDQDGR